MMVSSGYRLTRICASLVLVLVIGAQESVAFNWTSALQNGSLINDCTGNTVTFNWTFTINSDEHVLNEEWYFKQKGKADNNLIATKVAGNFLTVGGEPQPQVTQDETGIHLLNVTSADSGVYSVHLNVIGPSGQTVMGYQEVELDVAEGPQTSSGYLNVSLIPEPVLLKESGQYHARLVCGNFTTMGNPPVSLEWTTPGGHVYPSTFSTANNFTFAIPNPVESGNYTCRLNTSLPSEVCAKAGTLLSESASLLLDGQEIRLQLMEFRMTKLEAELAYLRGLKSDLDRTHTPGPATATRRCHQCPSSLST
ncbi:uncharacterized protein LOC112556408 isoform X1 [Pomacea canaliculata]|uniref:uncharacterized protein LOC112556408 isoform X1 n=1 Tax=Pomacea canaliculata TaxID=400727 RepID=UPI000D73755A|nr:uncharacterized protein LOC112556408 isoform X1 [Pomacea canaliculata]